MESIQEYLIFAAGLILTLGGAEMFVRSAVGLATMTGRSRLLIGLTLVAFGTSAPELAIGVIGALRDQADIGLGNFVGSNIFNILFVLGLAALLRPITIDQKVVRREIPILLGLSALFLVLAANGRIGLIEAILFLTLLIGYLVYMARTITPPTEPTTADATKAPDHGHSGYHLVKDLVISLLSVGVLALGSHWMVDGAVAIAAGFGVSELIIGLTIMAIGTSLPEIATTLVAVRRREPDLAIGNVLGSCVFNIMAVPAVMAIVAGEPLAVAPEAIKVDLPIMLATVVACLPIFISDHRMSRAEGILFLIYYAAYGVTLYYRSTPGFPYSGHGRAMILLLTPIIFVTLVIVLYRALRPRSHAKTGEKS